MMIDPDQTPQIVASDRGLHCLQMSLLWDAKLKWVKKTALLLKLTNTACFRNK